MNLNGKVLQSDAELCIELENMLKNMVTYLRRTGISRDLIEDDDGSINFICLIDHFEIEWIDGIEKALVDARERLKKNKFLKNTEAAKKVKNEHV
jgi:hypothetical protein